METKLVINQEKALEVILRELYFKEFEVIDHLNQHPQGVTFYRWLYYKDLITEYHLSVIEDELQELYKDDNE